MATTLQDHWRRGSLDQEIRGILKGLDVGFEWKNTRAVIELKTTALERGHLIVDSELRSVNTVS